MKKRIGPKRVKVFEAGAGDNPKGIFNQALKAQKDRVGRKFIASDLNLRKEAILRARGLKEVPRNLKLIQGCSVEELRDLPRGEPGYCF